MDNTRIFKQKTGLKEAQDAFFKILSQITESESIPIESASGRILSGDIAAKRDVPHYRRAAMDGYAVQAKDTFDATSGSPAVLTLVGADPDSNIFASGIASFECMRVHTGSLMPDSADAVVMIEDTATISDMVEVYASSHPGKHVGEIGEDVRKGEVVLKKGRRLRGSDVSLLASMAYDCVSVVRRPVVAVIPTGEEIVPRGITPKAGEIIESNSLMVGIYADKWGGVCRYCDIVTDDGKLIADAIVANLDANVDMIVLCGGTSVGARDKVPDVVSKLGKVLVHGIRLSPGKPTALGLIDDTPILCLPGYPVAGLVAMQFFLKPALMKLTGEAEPLADHVMIRARLSSKIASSAGFTTVTRVSLRFEDGICMAEPVMTSGAGILSSVALADGYVVVAEHIEGYHKGEEVDVVPIE